MLVSPRESRAVGGSAVAFAIALFVYLTLVNLPDMTTTNAETLVFYRGSGHRAQAVVGGYLALLVAVLFIVFLVGAVRRLRRRGSGVVALFAAVGGTAFVSLYLAAAGLFAAHAFALTLNNESVTLDSDVGLAMRTSSFLADSVMLWFAGFAAAGVVAATTFGGDQSAGRSGRWSWARWLWFSC